MIVGLTHWCAGRDEQTHFWELRLQGHVKSEVLQDTRCGFLCVCVCVFQIVNTWSSSQSWFRVRPHIWNVCFVFPLTGAYLVCSICFPWLVWPALTKHLSSGTWTFTRLWGDLPAPLVLSALSPHEVDEGPWNLLLTKQIWVETLQQNWEEGN